jgi:hypothetical protein
MRQGQGAPHSPLATQFADVSDKRSITFLGNVCLGKIKINHEIRLPGLIGNLYKASYRKPD